MIEKKLVARHEATTTCDVSEDHQVFPRVPRENLVTVQEFREGFSAEAFLRKIGGDVYLGFSFYYYSCLR